MGISFGVVQDFQSAGVRKVYKGNQLKSHNNRIKGTARTRRFFQAQSHAPSS
jgi:hypothetical protein